MLSELPATEVDNLCKILDKEWPQTISAINFLKTCSEWKKKKPGIDISILYNEENIQSGIFILIMKSGCFVPIITTYALDSYENELEEIFSNFIDKYECDGIVLLGLISKKHVPIMEKIVDTKSYKVMELCNLFSFSMDIEKAKNLEINYPSDVEMKSLKKEHLQNIYDKWVLNETHTIEELENCLELNKEFCLGIFCKNTGRLLCRCLRSHNGAISALQTIEEARGKGYAKLLLKHVSKKLAELSIIPYTYVADFNKISIKTVQGAGFSIVSHLSYIDIKRSNKDYAQYYPRSNSLTTS